uniref:Progestin and adipoQ receptor family member 4 n=2 Tax=Bactrocera latifrons TaxID=174628 RepID=A0A0K8U3W4_BACLA
MPWEQEYRFLSFCHLFGSVAPWCGSFIYHLFMNIESGEHVYYTLLKLDMVGIWVSQSFGSNGKFPLATSPLLRSALHYAFNIDTISNYGCMGWRKPDSTFSRLPTGWCIYIGWCYRRSAYTGEVVSWRCGFLFKFP